MNKEGLNLNSSNNNIVTDNKFIELSSFLYNRELHNKSVFVDVAEINIIVGINTILRSNTSMEELYELINSNYGVLFNTNLVNEIRSLSVKDLKDICIYHNDRDTFSGLEYHILRRLIDSHLDMFEDDIKSGSINKLIKLCVSKGNLIVKVFPKYSKDDNPVSYTISLLYLVLLHLCKHQYNEDNISKIIKTLFIRVVPVVTKVVYTININADDSYSFFKQLQQLASGYKFFDIKVSKNQVRLLFRSRKHYLVSTLDVSVKHETVSDTNYEDRLRLINYVSV